MSVDIEGQAIFSAFYSSLDQVELNARRPFLRAIEYLIPRFSGHRVLKP